jgi:hypothetical protein
MLQVGREAGVAVARPDGVVEADHDQQVGGALLRRHGRGRAIDPLVEARCLIGAGQQQQRVLDVVGRFQGDVERWGSVVGQK